MQPLTTSLIARTRSSSRAVLLVLAVLAVATVGVRAQLPNPVNATSQFDIVGIIESATLTGGQPNGGGVMVINGHTVTIPANTIVIMPATAMFYAELFSGAPAPYTGAATGLALADVPKPLATYEATISGNRTLNGAYVAGLVTISQQSLNTGAGYITAIDYSTGELFVGGPASGSRVGAARGRINDPLGRYGRIDSPDARFTVDVDNPTIRSVTGYPMCIPRTAPAARNADGTVNSEDPRCSESNREVDAAGLYLGVLNMNTAAQGPGRRKMNPLEQAPFEVGDWVNFAGTLALDVAGQPYISAHTIVNNIAIYTAPGDIVAYVAIDVSLMGTGGVTAAGLTEAVTRTRVEGFVTDQTRTIHLYAIDFRPDGSSIDRDWGRVGVDPGPAGGLGAARGRWRFRPPCTATAPSDKGCTPPAAGVFTPAPRELRAVVEGVWNAGQKTTAANGLVYGQYHAPIGEYIFPEPIPGAPVPPSNFAEMDWLKNGGYSSAVSNVVAGGLIPWVEGPSLVINPGTTLPIVTAAVSSANVASGAVITLFGSAVSPTPIAAWNWVQIAGPGGLIATPGFANSTFTAPVVASAQVITFTLTARNAAGAATSAPVSVTVNPPLAPTVSVPAPSTVNSGTTASLRASCLDPNRLPCTFVWTQLNANVLGVPQVVIPNPFAGADLRFTYTLPFNVSSETFIFQAVATNSAGAVSGPAITAVTVKLPTDVVTVTAVQYRTLKQRLLLTATSSVVNAAVVLTLQPYTSITGVIVDPGVNGTFLNNGAGLYTLDLVGVPQPAANAILTVTSNLGGSGTSPLTSVTK